MNKREDKVKAAMEAWSKKANHVPKARSNRGPRTDAPEKRVEKLVMEWLNSKGFSCNVVEAKAVFNPKAGRYISGQVSPGFPDVVGCDTLGHGVFIELKAQGKKKNITQRQYDFLMEKIDKNAFAYVADRVETLESAYTKWVEMKKEGEDYKARMYLTNKMPKHFRRTLF